MTNIRLRFLIISPLLLLATSCQKQQPQKVEAPFVAKVGDQRIAPEEFVRELQKRGGEMTAEKRETVLQNLIRTEALVAKAKEAGFDRDPETVARIKKVIASLYEEKLRGGDLRGTNSAVELNEYYQRHLSEFDTPEKIHAAMIFWRVPRKATDEKRREYRMKAEAVAQEAKRLPADAKGFGDLALANSEDQASRYQGGDLGSKTPAELQKQLGVELAGALVSLKPGSQSGLVETADGLYLFKLIERQEMHTKGFEEVKDLIAYRVTREKQAEVDKKIEDQIRSGLQIEIDRAILERIAPATNTAAPPPASPQA